MASMIDQDALRLLTDGNDSAPSQPVVQVLQVRKLEDKPGQPPRHRLVLSDGSHFCQAMLFQGKNSFVEDNTVHRFTLIRLTKFSVNWSKGQP